MHAIQASPTVKEVIHHDWTRKFFTHLPEDPLLDEHVGQPYVTPGTSLDYLAKTPDGLSSAILVARDPAARGRKRRLALWQGARRIHEETFYGLFGSRFQRISSATFGLVLTRASHFFIANPETDPHYVFPLPQFARFGVSHRVLEEILEAPVVIPAEGNYGHHAYVPSLRVFAHYDGNRYGDSTRKLFYDQNGRPVPVELVAREVLRRLGYEVVPPSILSRLFFALIGRPPAHFRPGTWPEAFLTGRLSPFEWVRRAHERITGLRDAGVVPSVVRSLEALSLRAPYKDFARPEGALPLVAGHLTRRRLESFLETIGEARLAAIFQGFARGHPVVSADWFAYMEGTHRVFPCEVKARGDRLRPYQKDSILYCQREGLLDYRLLELLHNVEREPRASSQDAAVVVGGAWNGATYPAVDGFPS